jgi:Spy/CpxP family protein refolding chaperone
VEQAGETARLGRVEADATAQIAALRAEVVALKSAASVAARPSREMPATAAKPATPAPAPAAANAALPAGAEIRLTRLDTLVHLTPEQRARVADALRKEAAALEQFTAGEDRAIKGMDARQATRAEVRSLLTPEQRSKYDVSPQSLGGGLPADPANMAASLDQVVGLTSEQKKKATDILWDDIMDQIAALPADQNLRGFAWRDKVRDRLREVLTPEQQAKFDTTPPYRKNNRPSGR